MSHKTPILLSVLLGLPGVGQNHGVNNDPSISVATYASFQGMTVRSDRRCCSRDRGMNLETSLGQNPPR